MEVRLLRGACSCGRNRYTISVPPDGEAETTVFLDSSNESRRIHASPLTAFLRVPLSRFQSSTYAIYSDEDHNSIRRTYTTPFSPKTIRQFCGFCGTQLSSWSERKQEDADYICLTLGTLLDDDMEILEEMGLLPHADEEEVDEHNSGYGQAADQELSAPARDTQQLNIALQDRNTRLKGSPWFEEIVEDSALGRMRRQKGGHISSDGMTRVEFEVFEIQGGSTDESSEAFLGKRKFESEGSSTHLDTNDDEQRDYYMSGALQSEDTV